MGPRSFFRSLWVGVGLLGLVGAGAWAQQPASRIGTIDPGVRVTLAHSRNPRTLSAADLGSLAAGTKIAGMSLMLAPSAAEEAGLQALLAAQQNPASALYHQWLTPEEYGAEFGDSDADLAKLEGWLEQEGFTVAGVSRSRNRVIFSGTAAQVGAAFGTELHRYGADGRTYYAPNSDLSVPAAVAGVVAHVGNLSTFRPHSDVRLKTAFTSGQTGSHYFAPGDIATAYDLNAAYSAGYTGAGQSIAIVGESAVATSDITNFQTAAGLPVKPPTLVLVPNSGTAAVVQGDEAESDLDLEWSGALAKGATIYFVYTGNNPNDDVADALVYAVEEKLAPVISISYGFCEGANSASFLNSENAYLAEAAAQGQSVIASSGDSGSAGCYGIKGVSTAVAEGLYVNWPASSQYAAAVGGTEITAANEASSTYWAAGTGTDVVNSALSYIPEIAWNDPYVVSGGTTTLSASGGGVSEFFPRPSWQTGVTGIAAGSNRLVPDVALYASPEEPGYLFCSSDPTTEVTGSCTDGFRDSSDKYLTVAGGTSFGAPIFAGMIAVINQAKNSTGQGAVGSTLYALAANAATYASAFHDITSGTNECPAASGVCTAATETNYATTTGYDEVTGLGSVDFNTLLTAWPSTTASSLTPTVTSLAAAATTASAGGSDAITITVAPESAALTGTPTGTVSVAVDGTVVNASLGLTGGTAVYSFSSSVAGSHTVSATYSGDGTFASSTGSVALSVGAATVSSQTGTFTVGATSVSVAPGASGSSTVTVTPAGGYTGTVDWAISSSATLTNACYSIADLTVPGTSAVSTTLTVYTSASACAAAGLNRAGSGLRRLGGVGLASGAPVGPAPGRLPGVPVALAGLLGLVWLRRARVRPGVMLAMALVGLMGLAGCGSGGSNTAPVSVNSTYAAAGTYALTLTGIDNSSSSITASTTVMLTVE